METKSNIYVPKDCMNEIIHQIKLLNTKKFAIMISQFPDEPKIDDIGDVCLYVVEANSKEEALSNIIKEIYHLLFSILDDAETNIFDNEKLSKELKKDFKKLIKLDDYESKERYEFIEKYKDILIPIIIKQDSNIRISEIKIGQIF